MLDNCTISHKGGVVLWSRSFTPAAATLAQSTASPVNNLIREALIEGRTDDDRYEKDGYTVRWTLANDLELIFVVAYQRILQLTYVEELLSKLKTLFIKKYHDFLIAFVASLHASTTAVLQSSNKSPTEHNTNNPSLWDFTTVFEGWDKIFDKILRDVEQAANKERRGRLRQISGTTTSTSTGIGIGIGHQQEDESHERASGASGETTPALDAASPVDGQEMAKNIAHLKTRLKNHGGKSKGGKGGMGRSSSGAGAAWAAGSGSDSDVGRKNTSNKNAKQKSKRTWGDVVPTEEDMSALDFSEKSPLQDESSMTNAISPGLLDSLVDSSSKGEKKGGVYEIRDWEFEKKKSSSSSKKEVAEEEDDEDDMEDFISRTLQEASLDGTPGGGGAQQQQQQDQPGYFSSLFSRLTGLAGTTRPLTQQDLAPVLAGMKEHLMKKNVAREIAERVCDGVGKSLEGKKVGGLKSIRGEVKNALEESITRILTPKSSTDILHAIRLKKSTGAGTGAGGGIGIGIGAGGGGNVKVKGSDPYSLTFVGVNGVGKSTNLSKVAFWLLQNDFRVLIAACDTFRSGAVEQLRVHVRNLGMLVDREREEEAAEERNEGGKGEKEKKEKRIELYERGYGKDAAGIAKDAIVYAKESGFDVVLIDTAGRMQDNEPLMRALAKLVAINQPDKIVFVGEALVGNEAVDQLVKFDRALRDFTSGSGKGGGGGGGGGGGASASGGQAGGGVGVDEGSMGCWSRNGIRWTIKLVRR
ncbi:hypothetical protein FRC16_010178 [Serendipita sp. 398]|nr:hypothetical protein FRC16_010178 [Serendipita sp. 398]